MINMKRIFWSICLTTLMMFSVSSAGFGQTLDTAEQLAEGAQGKDAVYPKIGLALGGGGARGFAHIGVIKVLEELGIPIDYVAGTSIGSIVGGLYASGYSAAEMEDVITRVNWESLFTDTPPRNTWSSQAKQMSSRYLFGLGFDRKGFSIPQGLTKGQKISTLFSFLTLPVSSIERFDDLPIPFRAVAADIETGEEVILDHGSLADAMRASMSVPGVFTPLNIDGHLLVDGGIVKNLPVDVVKAMGADIIIAVDVSSQLVNKDQLGNPFAVLNQMVGVQMLKVMEQQRKMADVAIWPDLKQYSSASFGNGTELTALGEEAARKQIDELKALADKIHASRAFGRSIPQSVLKSMQHIEIEDVAVVGTSGTKVELSIKKFFTVNKDDDSGYPLNPDVMANVVQTILGTGQVESIKFFLTPGKEPDGSILNLQLETKESNPHLLRFGMYYESRFNDDESDKLAFLTNVTFNDLTGRGSMWSTDLQFVNVTKFETRYLQPIFKGLFLLPEAYSRGDYQVLYDDQDSSGRYNIDTDGFSVNLGGFFSRLGFVSAGYSLEKVNATVKANLEKDADSPFDFDETTSSIVISSTLDGQDAYPFPHSGGLMEIAYRWANKDLGGSADFHKLFVNWEQYLPVAAKHTFGFRLQGGTDFDSELRPYAQFVLGGRDSFVGYKAEELRGNNIGIGTLEYRYQWLKLPQPVGGDLFVTLIGNVGNVWEKLDDVTDDFSLRYGGSAGIGVDTLLGPVTADFGLGDEGRYLFYLSIGKNF